MSDGERGRDFYLIASALALGAEALAAIDVVLKMVGAVARLRRYDGDQS
jgi:hypothetical protein